MIDDFAIGLTHVLLALVALRLLWRRDLDSDTPSEAPAGPDDTGPPGSAVPTPAPLVPALHLGRPTRRA